MPYTIEPKQGRPGCAYTRTPGRDQGRQARPPEPELSPYRSKGTREPGNQGTRGCAYTIEARPEAYQVCPGLGCRLWSLYSYRSKPGCALYQGRKAGKATGRKACRAGRAYAVPRDARQAVPEGPNWITGT